VRQNNVSRESARKTRVESGRRAVAAARTVQSPEIRRRVKELRKQEKAGELPPAATSYAPVHRRQELRIAREKIVVQPVNEVSLKRYKKLYEKAAEEYGFGDEWYVLAAVGKVESDHGQNMGPSSAGALGPMQFMPSTWDSYGLDANDDGQANIMDPEDAIPSAARYLKAGGAPDDWYEALYTYNHAGWYVEKVLKVAERYRRAAGDNEVGPYYLKDR
jgi:membrane-bound lytic murein transglycosylase B